MKNTKTVPNQRIIYIHRIRTNSTDGYLQVSTLSVLEAMYNLKGNAFKLWIYFVNNKDKYIKYLSSSDFCNKANISKNTFTSAFNELVEKGYLIQSTKKENIYRFKEQSDIVEHINIDNNEIDNISIEDYF